MTLGTLRVPGKLKTTIAGKAHVILYLEKLKGNRDDPNTDASGYTRVIHTQPYDNIDCGGRYTLPEPCPANLAFIFNTILGRK